MNLKELIKEVKISKKMLKTGDSLTKAVSNNHLHGIRQTVEAVDKYLFKESYDSFDKQEWQELKVLLGNKE